jgi:signal transduction histidine kinase
VLKYLFKGYDVPRKFQHKSINQINFLAILFIGIFAAIFAFIIIFNEYKDFQKDVALLEKNTLLAQKKLVVQKSLKLSNLIEYRYKNLEQNSKQTFYPLLAQEINIVLKDMDKQSYLFIFNKKGKTLYKSEHISFDAKAKEKISTCKGFCSFDTQGKKQKITNMAFVRVNEKLGLIFGCGVDLQSTQVALKQKTREYQIRVSSFILKIITLTLFFYIASILKYRYITEKVSKEIAFIAEAFKEASSNYRFIPEEKIQFKEFEEITKHANSMIEKIREKKQALEDLNINLESIIEEKTKELVKSIAKNKKLLKDQDKFIKNAIHELNTPLSIILMNIDLYNLKHEKNVYLIKIESAVKVLQNIYDDLSFIVKRDRVEYAKEKIDFCQYLNERVEYFIDVALSNNLKIVSKIEPNLWIFVSEFELQRLCDNNISNAIKYSYLDNEIFLRAYKKNEKVFFEIENIGDRIEYPERIFNRYYREDEARGGFGLGLNIVKEICDKNDITIEIDSTSQKTIFRYIFTYKGEELENPTA